MLGIIAAIALIARSYMQDGASLELIPIATAQRGTVTLKITETGTLQAAQSVTLASEITGNRAKIATIAPEGSYVNKGDLIIEFDKTAFEDELRKARADIAQAEAAIVEATENIKLQHAKNQTDLKEAEANIAAAEAELSNILEGEGVIRLREFAMDMDRSLGFGSIAYDSFALFRLALASAPCLKHLTLPHTITRRTILQKVPDHTLTCSRCL